MVKRRALQIRRNYDLGRFILAAFALLFALGPVNGQSAAFSQWFKDELREQVRSTLQNILPLRVDALDVRVHDATVYLSGGVGSGRLRPQAGQVVSELASLDRVVNNISVAADRAEAEQAISGDELETRIEQQLGFDPDQFGLVASGGVVRVDGIVTSRRMPEQITELLTQEFGVAQLSNAVTWVEQLPAGYDKPTHQALGK